MLTPEQDAHLDTREPDVRLCAHHIEVTEMGDRLGPLAFILRLKGHMVMEGDMPGGDGDIHVEDHRLFCVEVPMSPDVWRNLVTSLSEVDGAVRRTVRDQNRHPEGRGYVDPQALANFMNSIPEIFRRDPREDDDK